MPFEALNYDGAGRRNLNRRFRVCGSDGAAAENHDSNMVPTTRSWSQISDDRRIVPADIFALLWGLVVRVPQLKSGSKL